MMESSSELRELGADRQQCLGSGLSFRPELRHALLDGRPEVDFLEVIADRYMQLSSSALDSLASLADSYTLVPHGLGLSIGTSGRVSGRMLNSIRQVCRLIRAPYYSDHLAISSVPGIDVQHLSPIAYDKYSLGQAISSVKQVQDSLEIPFVVENITETHSIRRGELEPPEFLERLCEATGCGLLLDITNLYINSFNTGCDPIELALRMPLKAVVQVHLAGWKFVAGKLLDTHSQPVPKQVWDLFRALAPQLPRLTATVIERDANFPDFSELLKEIRLARQIMTDCGEPKKAQASGA